MSAETIRLSEERPITYPTPEEDADPIHRPRRQGPEYRRFHPRQYAAEVADELRRQAREMLDLSEEIERREWIGDSVSEGLWKVHHRVHALASAGYQFASGDPKRAIGFWHPRQMHGEVMTVGDQAPCASPIRWFGAKSRMIEQLLATTPPHSMRVDVFGGSGVWTLRQEPIEMEVLNDLDGEVFNFFRVLRSPRQAEELTLRCLSTPYSRELYEAIRDGEPPYDAPPLDDADAAYRFFVVNRMSYGGWSGDQSKKPAWSYSVTLRRGITSASVHVWLKGASSLLEVADRIRRVQLEKLDFRELLRRYRDMPPRRVLYYCDPPYVPETRVRGGYRHEMTQEDHEELIAILLKQPGAVMLSGYRHAIHEPLEASGWERKDYETRVFCSGKGAKKGRRVESVWLNPEAMRRLRETAPRVHRTLPLWEEAKRHDEG